MDRVRNETLAVDLLVEGPGGKDVTHGEEDSWAQVYHGEATSAILPGLYRSFGLFDVRNDEDLAVRAQAETPGLRTHP